jgi:hypothetical protein
MTDCVKVGFDDIVVAANARREDVSEIELGYI